MVLSRGDDGVLTAVMALGSWVKVPQIVSALDVAPSLVDAVIFGPAKALFTLDSDNNVGFSTPSFKEFLLDADRAGEYFIPSDKSDALFICILSHQPPSDPLRSYSREALMVWGSDLPVHRIAFSLDVDPAVIKAIIFGPAQLLFYLYSSGEVRLPLPLEAFLQDVYRAGEFYVSQSGTVTSNVT